MTDPKRGRKILWWNLNIDPDKEADTGRWMMRTVAVWLGAFILLALIIGLVVAIS